MARCRSIIEFGTSKILCLMQYSGAAADTFSGKSCVRYEGISDGKWVNKRGVLTALEKAVEDCELNAGQQMSKAIVGVPACFCYQVMGRSYRSFSNERLRREDVSLMLEDGRPKDSEGYTLIDERPIYFDDCAGTETLDAPIGHRVRRLYMFSSYTFIRNSHLAFIEEMLEKLNISLERIVMDQYAAALHCIPDRVRDDTALLVDVGYKLTSVSCVIGSAIAAEKCFFAGGSYITDALERKLDISPMLAENIKRNYILGIRPIDGGKLFAKDERGKMCGLNQHKVDSVMLMQADRIIDAVGKILLEYTANRFCERSTPVYLCGGGFAIRGMENYMSTRLGRRVNVVAHSSRAGLSPIYDTALSLLDNRIDWVYDSSIDEEKPSVKIGRSGKTARSERNAKEDKNGRGRSKGLFR